MLLWEGVRSGLIDVHKFVEITSTNPRACSASGRARARWPSDPTATS
jgi:hypothetical protein